MEYVTYREFYKYSCEHGETDLTTKYWDSLDKAINYAHRYAYGERFVSVTVEDEAGNIIYEIVDNGAVVNDYREKLEEKINTKEERKETVKLKRFGKNVRGFKKLVADETTTITKDGFDKKELFEKMIGYEFAVRKVNGVIELVDPTCEVWELKTGLEVVVI